MRQFWRTAAAALLSTMVAVAQAADSPVFTGVLSCSLWTGPQDSAVTSQDLTGIATSTLHIAQDIGTCDAGARAEFSPGGLNVTAKTSVLHYNYDPSSYGTPPYFVSIANQSVGLYMTIAGPEAGKSVTLDIDLAASFDKQEARSRGEGYFRFTAPGYGWWGGGGWFQQSKSTSSTVAETQTFQFKTGVLYYLEIFTQSNSWVTAHPSMTTSLSFQVRPESLAGVDTPGAYRLEFSPEAALPSPVPEPATAGMLLLGLACMGAIARQRA